MTNKIFYNSLLSLFFIITSCSNDSDSPQPEEQIIPVSAAFSQDKTEIIEGETIEFRDTSEGDPTSWKWTFEGGEPASSTLRNPSVKYSSEGIFSVGLSIQNAGSSDELVQESLIHVTNSLDFGLIANFDLNGNANDNSSFANNGEIINNVEPILNRNNLIDSAMNFDGESFIIVGDVDILNLTTDFTISVWIKPDDETLVPDTIISKWLPNSFLNFNDGNGYELSYISTGIFLQTSLLENPFQITEAISIDDWSNIIVLCSENSLKGYLNGNLVSEYELEGPISSSEALFKIGATSSILTAGAVGFNGGIDDLKIYNKILSDDEIQKINN